MLIHLREKRWGGILFRSVLLWGIFLSLSLFSKLAMADTVPPVTTHNYTNAGIWEIAPVTILFTAIDTDSGVKWTKYTVNGGPETQGGSLSIGVSGEYIINYWSEDNAGNIEIPKTINVKLDLIDPESYNDYNNSGEWENENITIHLTAYDNDSGIKLMKHTINGGTDKTGFTINLNSNGINNIQYWSVDNAGRSHPKISLTVKIDKNKPKTEDNYLEKYNDGIAEKQAIITLKASDKDPDCESIATSGVKYTYYLINDEKLGSGTNIKIVGVGYYRVQYWSVDNAGNIEKPHSINVKIINPPVYYNAETKSAISVSKCKLGVSGCIFSFNNSSTSGSAISSTDSTISISGLMKDNYCKKDGTIYLSKTGGSLAGCSIYDNVVSGHGGAVYIGNSSPIEIKKGAFINNYAVYGSNGVFNADNPYANPETGFSVSGPSHLAKIKDTILWNGNDLYNCSADMITNSNIKSGAFAGSNGNISADPKFRNPGVGDYSLRYDSPCINTGVGNDMGASEFIDSDNDGLPDSYEQEAGKNLTPDSDDDNDGLITIEEYYALTNAGVSDTDNDGLSDYQEVMVYHTDPLKDSDNDGDSLTDSQEILILKTKHNNYDTDGDLCSDSWEYYYGLNPLNKSDGDADNDSDGLANYDEYYLDADPLYFNNPKRIYIDANADNDGDGSQSAPYKSLYNAILDTDTTNATVFVLAPGVYNESQIIQKRLAILGESASNTAIVSESMLAESVFVDGVGPVVLKNLTLSDSFRSLRAVKGSVVVSDCILKNNTATPLNGGGVFLSESNAVFVDSVIDNNKSARYGAGVYSYKSNPVFINCEIKNNVSSDSGGGMYIDTGSYLKIDRSVISKNSAVKGAGLYCRYIESNVVSSTITGNTASSNGAGIYVEKLKVNLANSIVSNNSANGSGGGMYFVESQGNTENSVFISNSSLTNTGNAVYKNSASAVTLKNSIFWNKGNELSGFTSAGIFSCVLKDKTFQVNGNISANPKLIRPSKGDFHLLSSSPCVNAGILGSVTIDIDKEARPNGANVDIGVDEFVDTDNDGLPDYWESSYGSNLNSEVDNDTDNLSNIQEYLNRTDPLIQDTDNDGLADDAEVLIYKTNPTSTDTDLDGISDYDEINTYNTNPFNKDTDNDLMPDYWETSNGTNPLVFSQDLNADNDTLTNYEEYLISSKANDPNSPQVIYVSPAGSDSGDGSAQNPYKHIQKALKNYVSPLAIDLVGGTYPESIDITGNGGLIIFANSSTKAVISGNKIDYTVNINNNNKLVILKNLIIENGKGGVYCTNSQLIIKNCVIKNNVDSGIIFVNNTKPATVIDTIITRNSAIYGGGVYCDTSSPLFVNCLVGKNQAVEGGGIWVKSQTDFYHLAPTISNSDIVDNIASSGSGGGIYLANYDIKVKIRNCVIWGNGDDLYNVLTDKISYCNVEDFQTGTKIISSAPGFAMPLFDRYHITSASTMRKKGGPIDYAFDAHGESRPAVNCDIGMDQFADTDNDGLGDYWENFYNANVNPNSDNDNDGVTNLIEFKYFTNPISADTDGDNVSDALEISGDVSDPTKSDSDEDGLSDSTEISIGTDPLLSDTDGDGLPDKWEYDNGLNPASALDKTTDKDNDSLSNYEEYMFQSDPSSLSSPVYVHIDANADNDGTGTQLDPYNKLSEAIAKSNPPYIFKIKGRVKGNIILNSNFIIIGDNKTTSIIEAVSTTLPALTINNVGLGIIRNITVFKGRQNISIDKSNLVIKNCIITGNSTGSSYGGGVYSLTSSIEMYDSEISGNNAQISGAGLYMEKTKLLAVNSVIRNNTTNYDGGGVFADKQSNLTIRNSMIYNNSANHYGAGIAVKYSTKLTMVNTVLTSNAAKISGGGLYCDSSVPEITNCVFYKNTRLSGQGSSLFFISSNTGFIKNTIIWGDDIDGLQQDMQNVSSSMVSYCDIEDIGSTYNNNHNISSPPLFADAANRNFHLQQTSPCVNAGTLASTEPKDIDGDTRPHGPAVDIGIDEFIPSGGSGGR